MPCGGIYRTYEVVVSRCFHCNQPGGEYFVDEWDAYLHAACLSEFLKNDEGQIVLNHKHEVWVPDVNGGTQLLRHEGDPTPLDLEAMFGSMDLLQLTVFAKQVQEEIMKRVDKGDHEKLPVSTG